MTAEIKSLDGKVLDRQEYARKKHEQAGARREQ
jgi:hypothetical protein